MEANEDVDAQKRIVSGAAFDAKSMADVKSGISNDGGAQVTPLEKAALQRKVGKRSQH